MVQEMGGDDRETVWLGQSEPGKVSEPRLASKDKVKRPERGMLGKRTKYIEEKKIRNVRGHREREKRDEYSVRP